MRDSFWAGGDWAYADGLKTEYESRLRELRLRGKSAGDEAERVLVQEEIERATAEYKEKCDASKWLIF
jgi:hypothetical protein